MGQTQALFVFRKQQQGLNSLCVSVAAVYNNRYSLFSRRHISLNKIIEYKVKVKALITSISVHFAVSKNVF